MRGIPLARLALLVAGVLVTVAVAAPAEGHAAAFGNQISFGTGQVPVAIATGHFNDDTDPDLAVANEGSDNVSVLLGRAGAGFPAPTNFGVGSGPSSVAVGDFNLDTRADLAVANQGSDSVSVLLGNGSGGFEPTGNFGVGSEPLSVVVGDFDTDGRPDLAVANFSSDDVSILTGLGNGIFEPAGNFGVGDGPRSLAVANFGFDAHPDLAVANFNSDSATVISPFCAGTCVEAFPVGDGPRSVAAGDFDGDSNPDLAIANFNSDDVELAIAAPQLCEVAVFCDSKTVPVGNGPSAVTAPDLDLDGKSDVVVAEMLSSSVRAITDLDQGTGNPNTNPIPDPPEDCEFADTNGDGFPEPVCVGGSDGGGVLPQQTCAGASITREGTNGDDVNLNGTAGEDVIYGSGGNDTISGLDQNDKICGGPGNDNITGGNGNDSLTGDAGADTFNGGLGADSAMGELVLTHLQHRAAPLLRFRTRDHVELRTSPCRCGRTSPRVRCIGRTDDMLIVRGVNVFPSAVREVVSAFAPNVSGHILVKPQAPGVKQEPPLPVSVELGRGAAADAALSEAIRERLRSMLVVQTRVDLVPWGSLGRSEYKSKLVEH